MKKLSPVFLLFLTVFWFFSTGFYTTQKDSTQQKPHEKLPSSKATTPQDGSFQPNAIREYNEAYYILSRLNKSIGLPPNKFNFQSPQATLEHFVISARNGNYEDAAYALNLNLLPDNTTIEEAAELAEKLYFFTKLITRTPFFMRGVFLYLIFGQ